MLFSGFTKTRSYLSFMVQERHCKASELVIRETFTFSQGTQSYKKNIVILRSDPTRRFNTKA